MIHMYEIWFWLAQRFLRRRCFKIRNSKSIIRFESELKRHLLYNNWNAWKLCPIRNCSPTSVGCGNRGCVWTKARSTLALPVRHCMGTHQGSLEQNYLFVLPSAEVQAWGFVILKPDPPAFRFSELGNQVQIFRHFLYGFQYEIKLFALGQNLKCSFKSRLHEDWRS